MSSPLLSSPPLPSSSKGHRPHWSVQIIQCVCLYIIFNLIPLLFQENKTKVDTPHNFTHNAPRLSRVILYFTCNFFLIDVLEIFQPSDHDLIWMRTGQCWIKIFITWAWSLLQQHSRLSLLIFSLLLPSLWLSFSGIFILKLLGYLLFLI